MQHMFNSATAFNGDITQFDTGSVTDMRYMFYNTASFNQDISGWDVSKVTTVESMFQSAIAFNQDIGAWNTGSVTNMNRMFHTASSFDQDISAWDVTALTDATFMFSVVTLSTANYDALLVGWEGQAVQDNVTFSGGNSKYSCAPSAAATARAALIADHTWNISDGGCV